MITAAIALNAAAGLQPRPWPSKSTRSENRLQPRRAHPQAYVAYFNCSSLQSDAGDLEGAKDSLSRAIPLNPDFYPAYINLGGVLERSGANEQAIGQWRRR